MQHQHLNKCNSNNSFDEKGAELTILVSPCWESAVEKILRDRIEGCRVRTQLEDLIHVIRNHRAKCVNALNCTGSDFFESTCCALSHNSIDSLTCLT